MAGLVNQFQDLIVLMVSTLSSFQNLDLFYVLDQRMGSSKFVNNVGTSQKLNVMNLKYFLKNQQRNIMLLRHYVCSTEIYLVIPGYTRTFFAMERNKNDKERKFYRKSLCILCLQWTGKCYFFFLTKMEHPTTETRK